MRKFVVAAVDVVVDVDVVVAVAVAVAKQENTHSTKICYDVKTLF